MGEPETSLDNLSLDDDCFDCSGPTRGEQPRPRVDFGNVRELGSMETGQTETNTALMRTHVGLNVYGNI